VKKRGWPDRRGIGSQSDTISELFVPSERHKEQQRAIAQALVAAGLNPAEFESVSMPTHVATKKTEPHLIDYQGACRCSICKMPFSPDIKPSPEEAFAAHVREAHRPAPSSQDLNQVAPPIVRETTEH
jgi:hypothetical protein